ncbi:hypothetical protein DB41_CH00020 [Neochlamydia sp. TUME1]|nr:hypothetical protein DB41_CH00020 [Neochlamydia sp. TUME1]
MVLVWVKGKVNLVHKELVVEVINCAIWVVCVGVVLEALVHIVK